MGPLTALTPSLLGLIERFPDGKHVVSYVGLAPAINASAENTTSARSPSKVTRSSAGYWARRPRWPRARTTIFGAAISPSCSDAAGPKQKSPSPASSSYVYVMLRDQVDYDEFRRRGRLARAPHKAVAVT